jgi:hypothetical protein
MPEICRFEGIIIRMFWETGSQHHIPHLHASYQGQVVSYRIDTADPLAGELPKRQHRLLVAWIELHRDELQENWQRAANQEPLNKIPPLR